MADDRVWDENGFLVSGAATHPIDDAPAEVEEQAPTSQAEAEASQPPSE